MPPHTRTLTHAHTWAAGDDLIVWVADQLQSAAADSEGSRMRALKHRVVTPAPAVGGLRRERLSLIYELRAPPSAMPPAACRHGMLITNCSACRYYPV